MFDTQSAVTLLKKMLFIRHYEELVHSLHSQGYIKSTIHLAKGQEASAVGICSLLNRNDVVTAGHRADHIALAKGISAEALLAETMGLRKGLNGGNAGPMHIYDKNNGFWGANGIVAANIGISAGIALSKKLKAERGLVVAYTGDGATTEGVFHETMNMAALNSLPLIVVCENNLYAQSTKLAEHSSNIELAEKISVMYRVKSKTLDGNDLASLMYEFYKIYGWVLQNQKPYFLVLDTYRYSPHSENEGDSSYRESSEVNQWEKSNDPIERFKKFMIDESLIKSKEIMEINMQIEKEMKTLLSSVNFSISKES